jgi:methyltransferase (TIGR00027 family)
MNGTIRNVSDTALWVAMYRALESERRDALFSDPFARRLAGARGEQILDSLPRGRAMSWPMVVRTAVMDEIVLRCAGAGCTAVLNLAAGLCTRAYRLPLPPSLQWFDADLPDMIDYKRTLLAAERPRCRYEAVAVDLREPAARQALFARVAALGGPALAVAEGLLIYLADEDVQALCRELHAASAFRWLLCDLASPPLLRMLARTWGRRLAEGNAPLRFAPAAGTAFFAPLGWREAEFRSTWDEARRLRRTMRGAWLWNLLGRMMSARKRERFRRFSGIVLFERA